MNWKELFNQTFSAKLKVGDRVRHRTSNRLGTVFQTAVVHSGVADVPAVSVNHDDGTEAQLVPAEEYHKVVRQSLYWSNSAQGRQYER